MRPYVICHMMPSVDGRLRTRRWDIPNTAHDEYERTAETFRADAWVCGRKTMEEFASGRRRPRRGQVNLPLALRKLREKFGVKRLLLEGGGETNGSFLRAKLVNELSLLVTPVADGGIGEPALFDVEGRRPARAVARLALKSARRIGAGMVWLRYAVRNAH